MRVDWHVLAFVATSIAFSTIVCGLVPAWRLSRIAPQDSLKAGGGNATEGGRKLWFREIMVSLEVALSTVSLITGGLLMVSFFRLVGVDKGFEITRVITQDVSFLSPKYANGERRGFLEEMAEKLARLPGVQAVGAVSHLPLLGEEWMSTLRDPDTPRRPPAQETAIANFRFVTPGYFKAMGISLRQGRFLQAADRDHPSAVISEQAARVLWGRANPIGKHVQGAGPGKPSLQVVGIVGEVRSKLEDAPAMIVYEHYGRMQPGTMSSCCGHKPRRHPSPAASASSSPLPIRKWRLLPPAQWTRSWKNQSPRAGSSCTSRRRLPFRPSCSRRWALCALLTGRLIASQLFSIAPNDPPSIAGVAALLLAVALLACRIPARRATKIDPLTALRFD